MIATKCVTGYSFELDGEQYQKCRYMAFMPVLSEENNPYIKQFLERELSYADDIKGLFISMQVDIVFGECKNHCFYKIHYIKFF